VGPFRTGHASMLSMPQCDTGCLLRPQHHLNSACMFCYRAAPPAPPARRRGRRRRARQLLPRGLLRDPPQGRPRLPLAVWKTLNLLTSVQRRRWGLVLRQTSGLPLARPSAQPWQQVRHDWTQWQRMFTWLLPLWCLSCSNYRSSKATALLVSIDPARLRCVSGR
jgi:hypothetical protein